MWIVWHASVPPNRTMGGLADVGASWRHWRHRRVGMALSVDQKVAAGLGEDWNVLGNDCMPIQRCGNHLGLTRSSLTEHTPGPGVSRRHPPLQMGRTRNRYQTDHQQVTSFINDNNCWWFPAEGITSILRCQSGRHIHVQYQRCLCLLPPGQIHRSNVIAETSVQVDPDFATPGVSTVNEFEVVEI